MAIDIINYKLVDSDKYGKKMVADVAVNGWLIRSLKVFYLDGGKPWVVWPGYKTKRGRWIKYCIPPSLIKDEIDRKLITLYENCLESEEEYSDTSMSADIDPELEPF